MSLVNTPADSLTNTWEDKADERLGLHTPEVKLAIEVASQTTGAKRGPAPPGRGKMNNGLRDRDPINGISVEKSNMLRHIVGLRYSGDSYREAFEDAAIKYEIKPHSVENYYYKHQKEVDLVEQEHLEYALKSYHNHLWAIRSMMSDAGPRAVRTLIGVMDDKKSSPNIKLKAAAYILKMVNTDGSASSNPSEHAAVESLKLIKDLREGIQEEKESHIVEAVQIDDAEIVEDDAGEDRVIAAV
jgi:hypothetical protein